MVLGRQASRIVGLVVGVAFLSLALLAAPAWAQMTTLTVDKIGDPNTVEEGDEVTYTINVTNTGSEIANNVTLVDELPEEFDLISANSDDFTCAEEPADGTANEVTCNLDSLSAADTATVTIVASAAGNDTFTNRATANGDNAEPASDTANTIVGNGGANDQNGTTGEAQVRDENVSPTGSCPGAREALTITNETGSTLTEPFNIEGDRFRITSTVENTEFEQGTFFIISVEDANSVPVAVISQEKEGAKTSFVNEGPGEFSLEVDGVDANYTILVEDCVGSDENNNESGADDVVDENDDNNADDNDRDNVINVPDKDLPETGGPPLLGVALFLLAGAGLLTAVVRRRR